MDTIGIVILAYLIGSFPHLLILAKLNHLPTDGDLHMTLWQKTGPIIGFAVVLVDILKGVGTVWLVRLLGFDISSIMLCGVVATAGQMWPVWRHFDGEKGNTTGYGAALAVAVLPTLTAVTGVIAALLIKLVKAIRLKNIPKGQRFKTGAGQSMVLPVGVAVGFIILPIAAYWLGEADQIVVGFAVLSTLVFIRRLTAGLSRDLKTDTSRLTIIWQRLLLDRGQH